MGLFKTDQKEKERRKKRRPADEDDVFCKTNGACSFCQVGRVRRFVRDKERMDEMEREYWEGEYEED